MDTGLRDELLLMRSADLQLRSRLAEQGLLSRGYNEEMAQLHRRHGARLAQIIDAHGWPGRSLVGAEGCDAAWLVLQHCIGDPSLMRRAEPLLEAAVRAGDAPPAHLAYLSDRIRTLQGLPQVYGTQHDWDDDGNMSPLPIEDAAGVEARRARLGMESLVSHTARLREQVRCENEHCPDDLAAHRRGGVEWARSMGWRAS